MREEKNSPTRDNSGFNNKEYDASTALVAWHHFIVQLTTRLITVLKITELARAQSNDHVEEPLVRWISGIISTIVTSKMKLILTGFVTMYEFEV